jgi:hypothetical protein
MTDRVRLIHWHAGEARARATTLRAAGFQVKAGPLAGPAELKALRARPPDVFVIDLTRLPAQGRDIGVMLRHQAATRPVPLVFAGGDPDKVARVRDLLPGAVFTDWPKVAAVVRKVLRTPPPAPEPPASVFAGYSGVPLAKKLGIKEGTTVGLFGAPRGFTRTLGALPRGAVVRRDPRTRADLAIWFVRSRAALERGIGAIDGRFGAGGVWIAWPKKGSALEGDVSQHDVRRAGLASGLVDYKICAIDQHWSGLKFARRAPAGRARR